MLLLRRHVLRAVLATVAVLVPVPGAAARRPPADAVRLLLDRFRHRPAMCDIGAAYLRQAGAAERRDLLDAAIFGTRAPPSADAACRMLALRRAHDFAAGNLAEVDGWVLSATEARLCALAAIGRGTAA